ncbi:MAG: GAF domain-containing protein, partial [Asgard group archaeon]|nr:GAF domain-containing protein [Asgard group archaeon]
PVISTFSPIRLGKDEIENMNVILLDITDIKKLEDSLKSSYYEFDVLNTIISAGLRARNLDQLLDFILDSLLSSLDYDAVAIVLIDEEKEYARLERSLGFPRFLRQSMEKMALDKKPFRKVFTQAESLIIENFQEISDKHQKMDFTSLMAFPFFSKNEIIGAIMIGSKEKHAISSDEKRMLEAISREIGNTILKAQIEEKLQQKQQNLQQLLNTIPDPLFIVDTKTIAILDTNRRVRQLLGYSESQLKQKTCLDIVPEYEEQKITRLLKEILKTGEKTFNVDLLTAKNKKIPMIFSAFKRRYNDAPAIICFGNVTE